MSLEAQNISVQIGAARLLEQVSLAIQPSQFLAVLGPNGAGKSTFLKVLCGEITPSLGMVCFDQRPLRNWKPLELAKRRAVLPQDSSLEFGFTALEVALLGRNPFIRLRETERDVQIAQTALAVVDAAHLESRSYPTLSGGERQRVQLARVLAQIWGDSDTPSQGSYLLLDEPTSSLDLAHQHETLAIAKGLSQQGIGVLAVLHDLNLAAMYATQVAVLARGRLVAYGTPQEVLNQSLIQSVFGVQCQIETRHGQTQIQTLPLEPKPLPTWRRP